MILIFVFGLAPNMFLKTMEPAVERFITAYQAKYNETINLDEAALAGESGAQAQAEAGQ